MGCRFSRSKKQAKTREPSHHRQREENVHYVDEYGQPITMQDGRRGRGQRKRRSHCAVECNVPTERHWEALRAMGLMEGDQAQQGPYYSHMTVSPELYSTNGDMVMSPDVYPPSSYLHQSSNEQQASNYLPSVSYSLDHLDRLDYPGPEMMPYQPNSEGCLIGCYAEEMDPNNFPRQSDYPPAWRSDRVLGYLPLSELDSGLGCGPDSPPHHHRGALSEVDTDAMSSLPGHTPSSQGSSSSSESLISSEPSDSGFHSVSTGTGEHRRLHKIHAHNHLRSGHSPREQRGRWDLESIPEATLMTSPPASRCTVGNSTTTTVHFHRAERSPTLPRHHSPRSPNMGCRTEPCQRRALWLEQQQQKQHGGSGRMNETPSRSQTITDLSESQSRRRASHPNMPDPQRVHSSQSGASNTTLGPRSRASYPTTHLGIDRNSLTNQGSPRNMSTNQNSPRNISSNQNSPRNNSSTNQSSPRSIPTNQSSPRSRRDSDSLSKSPGSGSSGVSADWRGIQTLGYHSVTPKSALVPLYSTLAAPPRSPHSLHSPPSPRSRLSNQKSVRNQLLRARAYRLARERSEVTTDEEVRGDGQRGVQEEGDDGRWSGRYCSRTERRRHLALSRQQRERRGVGEEPNASLSSQTLMELSHRKQNRLRNSKLLDDWTTVEELLTHGTRVENDNQLCPSPLLSVTTV